MGWGLSLVARVRSHGWRYVWLTSPVWVNGVGWKGNWLRRRLVASAVRIWTGRLLEAKRTSRQGPLQTSGEAGQEHRGKIWHRDRAAELPQEK